MSTSALYMISHFYWDFRQVFRKEGDDIKRCHGDPPLFKRGLAISAYWVSLERRLFITSLTKFLRTEIRMLTHRTVETSSTPSAWAEDCHGSKHRDTTSSEGAKGLIDACSQSFRGTGPHGWGLRAMQGPRHSGVSCTAPVHSDERKPCCGQGCMLSVKLLLGICTIAAVCL